MLLMLLSHGHNGVRNVKGSDAADAPVSWGPKGETAGR